MKEIKDIQLVHLRNGDYYQLLSDIDKLIQEETLEKLSLTTKYTQFKSTFDVVGLAYKAKRGSDQTPSVIEADYYRDKLDRGFGMQVDSYKLHWDELVVESALVIGKIIDRYGNLRQLSYNEESSGLTNKMDEITSGANAVHLVKLQLTDWATKVKEANNGFITSFGDRANEQAAKLISGVRNARKACDSAYGEVVNHINALVVINGEANYAAFIDKVNYYIDYYSSTLKMRQGHNTPETAEETI